LTEDAGDMRSAPAPARRQDPGPVQTGTKLVGRYLVGEMIGRGGMATVFQGRDELLARDVAVKVFGVSGSGATRSQQEFLREARAAAALSHPNIAGVFDVGVHGADRFIVMEYVSGGSLADLIQDEAPLPPRRVIPIIAQLADALDYGHRHGIVHCDVKPQNVLIDDSGRPKLVDFGISRSTAGTAALTDTVSGTAGYIAPEQLLGDPVDGGVDLYALACVAYELLCGELPFDASNLAALATQRLVRPPIALRARNPDVPAPIADVIMRALQRSPADRYATGQDFARALRAGAGAVQNGSAPVRRNPTTVFTPDPAPIREGRLRPRAKEAPAGNGRALGLVLAGAMVALVLAGVGATYWLPALQGRAGGTLLSVPAVKTERLDVAADQLHNAGFAIAVTFQDTTTAACTGMVLDQEPAGSATLASGGTVRLVVSRNHDC
jgi:hypothetical protein